MEETSPNPKDAQSTPQDTEEHTVDGSSIILENEEADEQAQETKKEGIKGIISTIAILIIAPLIALSLTAFVFQSYEVDGPSMETTLQNQDRLIVYKLPRTIARITGKAYVPKRADIIIFTRNDSTEFGTTKPRQLIKRVIALPGERLTLKDGVYTVYNKENPDGFNPDKAAYGKVITTTAGDIPEIVIPENSVFVSGDNRPNSLDSRAFGPVPLSDIVGKLSLRVYPFNKGQAF
jgi:signal peptidase I